MQVKIYDELPLEAKKIREDVFVKEQGFNEEFDIVDNDEQPWNTLANELILTQPSNVPYPTVVKVEQ